MHSGHLPQLVYIATRSVRARCRTDHLLTESSDRFHCSFVARSAGLSHPYCDVGAAGTFAPIAEFSPDVGSAPKEESPRRYPVGREVLTRRDLGYPGLELRPVDADVEVQPVHRKGVR